MKNSPLDFRTAALLVFVVFASSGCALLRSPDDTLSYQRLDSASADRHTLLVLLPGAWDNIDDFHDSGLVALVQERRPEWDMVLVDAHMGYYRNRSFPERLREDILDPVAERGYQRVWLSGPSLGGFGSLLYACREPWDQRLGVIAIAPHLGGRSIIRDVREAGGARNWQPGEAGKYHERLLWQCLVGQRPFELWMGWGEDDRLAAANAMLAETIDPANLVTRPGGHRWDVWVPLWASLFDAMDAQNGTRPR